MLLVLCVCVHNNCSNRFNNKYQHWCALVIIVCMYIHIHTTCTQRIVSSHTHTHTHTYATYIQWAPQVDIHDILVTLPVNVRLREILRGLCVCTCVFERERHRERVYPLTGKETETQQDQPVYIIHLQL